MKAKILVVISSIFLIFGLSACSNNKADKSADTSSSSSSAQSSSKKSSSSSKNFSTKTKSTKSNSDAFALMIKAAQSQLPQVEKEINSTGMFSKISIDEGENNTVVYTYTFAEQQPGNIDADALKKVLVPEIAPILEKAKVIAPDVKVLVNYNNPDGSNIASITITSDDVAQASAN